MLRPNILLLWCLLLFASCSQQSSKDKNIPERISIISSRDESNTMFSPTISREIKIENDVYNLTIAPDSSNHLKNNSRVITLKRSDTIVVSKTISVLAFADSIRKIKSDTLSQLSVEYESIRSNRLYFVATIKSQKLNLTDSLHFAIFFRTYKKGQLDYWRQNNTVK